MFAYIFMKNRTFLPKKYPKILIRIYRLFIEEIPDIFEKLFLIILYINLDNCFSMLYGLTN